MFRRRIRYLKYIKYKMVRWWKGTRWYVLQNILNKGNRKPADFDNEDMYGYIGDMNMKRLTRKYLWKAVISIILGIKIKGDYGDWKIAYYDGHGTSQPMGDRDGVAWMQVDIMFDAWGYLHYVSSTD